MASKSREWTATTDLPPVLSAEVEGDRVLATAEIGEISVVVEAPVGVTASELSAVLADVPESIVRTTERFAAAETETTMSANTTEIDRSTDVDELSADELREQYLRLDDVVGHRGVLDEDDDAFEELYQRYMAVWKKLEERAEDYPECPECGEAHWEFETGGPAFCADCDHQGDEELQETVHEAAAALLEGGA